MLGMRALEEKVEEMTPQQKRALVRKNRVKIRSLENEVELAYRIIRALQCLRYEGPAYKSKKKIALTAVKNTGA
jgi:hypothetical protein